MFESNLMRIHFFILEMYLAIGNYDLQRNAFLIFSNNILHPLWCPQNDLFGLNNLWQTSVT